MRTLVVVSELFPEYVSTVCSALCSLLKRPSNRLRSRLLHFRLRTNQIVRIERTKCFILSNLNFLVLRLSLEK